MNPEEHARTPGERIMMDIISMMHPSATIRKLWLLIVQQQITENTERDTFFAPCCCFEYTPYTALTIV